VKDKGQAVSFLLRAPSLALRAMPGAPKKTAVPRGEAAVLPKGFERKKKGGIP
jgi:hypothetical protein